jgi:hypothetical protein
MRGKSKVIMNRERKGEECHVPEFLGRTIPVQCGTKVVFRSTPDSEPTQDRGFARRQGTLSGWVSQGGVAGLLTRVPEPE